MYLFDRICQKNNRIRVFVTCGEALEKYYRTNLPERVISFALMAKCSPLSDPLFFLFVFVYLLESIAGKT